MLKLCTLIVVQALNLTYMSQTNDLRYADCGCLCVDGVAKTLCQSVEEARRKPNVCPEGLHCPTLPLAPSTTEPPGFYDPPADGAHNCREVRV